MLKDIVVYVYLLVYLFTCFRRTKVTSFAMEKIVYVPVADDLFQDGALGIWRRIVLLASDLSPHSSGALSLKEKISQSPGGCILNPC